MFRVMGFSRSEAVLGRGIWARASRPYGNIDVITATVGRGDCFVVLP